MSAQLLDGKAIAADIREQLKTQVAARVAAGRRRPGLVVVLVGDNPASQVYVRNKRNACEQVGFQSELLRLPADTGEDELLTVVDGLNARDDVDGILVQLPLPDQINADTITERILPTKDVDGFHPYNVGRLVLRQPLLRPCTPRGVMTMLARTGIDLVGKDAVIVGQSNIVGRPMFLELLMARCTVTVCHSKTRDLAGKLRAADIVVAAMGCATLRPGRLGQAGGGRDRRRHQPPGGRQPVRRCRHRPGQRDRRLDHPGAGRGRPDDGGDAVGKHPAGRRTAR